MNFLEYINSYSCCAINAVPADVRLYLIEQYPDIFRDSTETTLLLNSMREIFNIRFVKGKFVSFCCHPYSIAKNIFSLDAVIRYEDLENAKYSLDGYINDGDINIAPLI